MLLILEDQYSNPFSTCQHAIRQNNAAIGIYLHRSHTHCLPLLLLLHKTHTHTHTQLVSVIIELVEVNAIIDDDDGEEADGGRSVSMEVGLNLKETELCLGLPGGGSDTDPVKVTGKRGFSETVDLKLNLQSNEPDGLDLKEGMKNSTMEKAVAPPKDPVKPPAKAQVVGWPPVRSFRKNIMANQKSNNDEAAACSGGAAFVKVSMDGAPYLRKVDLKMYKSYQELSDALAKMFSSFTMGNYGTQGMIDFMKEGKLMDLLNSSEYVPTYEDKDGDWMLVGDVPWVMFVDSCKRLRIMKGSEAIGLAPRAMEKCKSRC